MTLLMVGTEAVGRRTIITWSVACAVLTLLAFAIVHGRGPEMTAASRLVISLLANAVTTILLLRGKAVYAAMQVSESRYRSIFNELAVGIWEHDFTTVQAALSELRSRGVFDLRRYIEDNPSFVAEARRMVRITDVNATAMTMMGVHSQAEFFSHLSDFLPETDDTFAECLIAIDERRALFIAETMVQPRRGDPIDVIVMFSLSGSGPLARVPGSVLDVSQRKRLEMQMARTRADLAQVQRASALGAMTASIAHEINQPLAAISGYTDAACRWLRRDPPAIEEVDAALKGLVSAVDHAGQVVQRVRALVGNARTETQPVDLNDVIREAASLFERGATEGSARIVLEPEPDPVVCEADPILLKQLLVNLVTNAIQAMHLMRPTDRVVTLCVRRTGTHASIAVEDNGPGWDIDRDSAFQTFYTTKAEGMGLGLSICKATMESLDGAIELGTTDQGGASVLLKFQLGRSASGGSPSQPRLSVVSNPEVSREEPQIRVSRI
ncbi:sensor histidine kinase [Sphingomonas albertensis]|uniref:histidine kinase n=1 Tax=Sphingomonas albertensis TaxID=2762591 RepID=A0ABR7AN83_9SPHN|nr:ATP-binding protein [Sphingomonas albertensis]MBC3941920.1 GHKL domain-containing protein [Sphingomonas albertensis]